MKNTEYPTMIKMHFAASQWRNGWHCMSAALLLAVLAASNRQARADIALVDTAAEAGLSMSIAESGQNSVAITNFTVSPMANVLVVLVEDKGASAVNSEPATLTWGSQTILKAVAQDNPNTNLRGESIYYLFNPTPGTNTIAATVANNPLNVEITAYTLSGVDTTMSPKVGSGGSIGANVTFTVSGVVAGSWAAANTTWSSQTPVPTITGTGGSNFMTSFLMVDNQSTILTAGYIAGLSGGTDTFAAAWATGTQKNNFAVAVFAPLATAINITAASATPNPVPVGTPVLLSVTATSTGGSITNVVVNASAVGGPSVLPLNLAGGHVYTNSVTAAIPTLGAVLPVTLRDNVGNTLAGSVRVVVQTLADMQFDAYNNAYLIQTQSNLGLVYYARSLTNRSTDGGWTLAIDIEGAEDAYERTHSPVHQQLVNSLCTHFLLQSPMPWSGDYWNDDIGWFSLVLVRGYQMTGNTNYLNAAEYGFNMAFARGWDTNYNNGGIWERQPSDMPTNDIPAKNPLACDSLLQTVCMIYQSTGDTNYLNRALQIYGWVRTNIFNPATGHVYGQVDTNGVVDTSSMLYNQGTFVECANLLHNITGQQMYYDDALKAVEYTRNNITVNGIFSKSATYLYTWAAEYARGMGHFVKDNNLWSTYYPWMFANATTAWNCRRPDYNVSWNVWTAPTPTTNDLSIGWAVNAVAMTQFTPETQPGLVNCTNQLHGTVIGTSGSWNNSGNTITKVFDGNLNTYFDAPDNSGDWVGLDFGVGVSNVIGQISYWPRIGWSGRMLGGVFQGDNSTNFPNPVTLFNIATAPPENNVVTPQTITNTNAFRCVRYVGPSNGSCNVAELQFFAPNPAVNSLSIVSGPTWSPASVYVGQTASATVSASGTGTLAYQWKAGMNGNYTNLTDGGNLSGSTNATLLITSAQLTNALSYIVVITNASVSVTSTPAILTVLSTGPATNFTLNYGAAPISQGVGKDWNTVNQWNPSGLSAANAVAAYPGSSFEVVVGALLRNPAGSVNNVFPGDTLQLDGDGNTDFNANPIGVGEIRFKNSTPGIPSTNYFKNLVLNGGELNIGDSTDLILQGKITVQTNSVFGTQGGSGTNQTYRVDSYLTGSGTIVFFLSNSTPSAALNITGTTNTFTGQWNVLQGPLLGSGVNSLGTNSITIGASGVLETAYPINNTNSSLILNGRMFLTQTDTFNNVVINGTTLAPGTYSAATLSGLYTNFPATFAALYGTTATSASGAINIGNIVVPPSSPHITSIQVSGTGGLNLSATNGTPGGSWVLLQSTNVALPLNQWQTNTTGTFDGSGNLSTNIFDAATNMQSFYVLKVQ